MKSANRSTVHWACPVLLVAYLATLSSLRTNANERLATPSQADWMAYKKVETAVTSAVKQPGERISKEDLQGWLLAKNWLSDGKNDYSFRRWRVNYPHEPYYAGDAKTFSERAFTVPTPSGPGGTKPANPALSSLERGTGFKIGVHLRQSYSDILGIEDPTQNTPKKTVDDLQGGLFSYSRDLKRDVDIWSAQAALILSIVRNTGFTPNMEHWGLTSYGIIPSVSIYRVSGEPGTSSSSTKNVDQLTFRTGVFSKWSSPGGLLDTLTLRGFATYLTDTGFRSSVPAGQMELEPQLLFNEYLTVGYVTELKNKPPPSTPGKTDWKDSYWLAYQLRMRLHIDGGSVSDSGRTGADTGPFFRIGPIIDFQLKPLIDKRLSLSLSYQYLPALVGPNRRSNLFSVSSEFDFYQNPDTKQTVSIKASYTDGGVDLTKQPVNTFQVGLGATF